MKNLMMVVFLSFIVSAVGCSTVSMPKSRAEYIKVVETATGLTKMSVLKQEFPNVPVSVSTAKKNLEEQSQKCLQLKPVVIQIANGNRSMGGTTGSAAWHEYQVNLLSENQLEYTMNSQGAMVGKVYLSAMNISKNDENSINITSYGGKSKTYQAITDTVLKWIEGEKSCLGFEK